MHHSVLVYKLDDQKYKFGFNKSLMVDFQTKNALCCTLTLFVYIGEVVMVKSGDTLSLHIWRTSNIELYSSLEDVMVYAINWSWTGSKLAEKIGPQPQKLRFRNKSRKISYFCNILCIFYSTIYWYFIGVLLLAFLYTA